MTVTPEGKPAPLPRGRLIAFSLMSIPIAGAQMPVGTYLPTIYAQNFGLPLATLGLIFFGERVWGTLTDPLVGWLCDRTGSRFGRRRVWIVAGTALFAVSYFLLFFPLLGITPVTLTVLLVLLYLAWSMILIPFYAWSGELSPDYHERTRITTYQTVVGSVSLFVILLLPALGDWIAPGDPLFKLHAMGAAVLLPLLPATWLAMRAFPDTIEPPARKPREKLDWREAWRAVMAEKAIFKVMLADFAIVFAQGVRGGLFLFYVGFVLGRPDLAASMFLFQFVFGMLAAPLWQAIARRIGKHKALIATEVGQALVNLPLFLLGANDVAWFMLFTLGQGLMQGSGNLLLRSMLADLADEYRLRTGQDRTAMLFSVFSVTGKAGTAVPLGIALPLVAWFGFDPVAAHNPPAALLALGMVFALGPALAHACTALVMRKFDFGEDKLAAVRATLAAPAAR